MSAPTSSSQTGAGVAEVSGVAKAERACAARGHIRGGRDGVRVRTGSRGGASPSVVPMLKMPQFNLAGERGRLQNADTLYGVPERKPLIPRLRASHLARIADAKCTASAPRSP